MRILVTGATGYVGGRLVPRLLEAGHDVCVLVRQAGRVTGRFDEQRVGVIEGDLLVPASLEGKLGGFDAAYYLVHSMMGGAGFDDRDTQAASNFAAAASACPHVIYLGGLMPTDDAGSPHLSSRAATGRVLAERLPGRVTEFRAGPIIGSGSASFEMVRYLTERLPVMVTPRWVSNVVEPIAVRDVLAYLVAALNVQPAGVVEIGAGALTFRDMMQRYAQRRGLSRRSCGLSTTAMPALLTTTWFSSVVPGPLRAAV